MTDREKIEALVDEELTRANMDYPLFRSPHEAYAVMREEVEEMLDNLDGIQINMRDAWECVKNDSNMEDEANMIHRYTVSLIQEAIQVAAMAKKVIMSELYK